MTSNFKEGLIQTILKRIPEGDNPSSFIANVLNLEREYVYRRLRGETNFTVAEIASLARAMEFSLDNIIGVKKQGSSIFELHFLGMEELEDIYMKKIERNSEIVKIMNDSKDTIVRWAGNTIPFVTFNRYRALNKFHFYKWAFQTSKINTTYSDFKLSDNLTKRLRTYSVAIQPLSDIIFIIDNNFISSVIRNLEYCHERQLMTDDEILEFKEELLDIANSFENMATSGNTKQGGKFDLYISPMNINSSYTHVENKHFAFCQYSVYTINTLNSTDKKVCDIQKGWIEALKQHSTSVSGCNDLERYKYFARQRELIDDFGKAL